MDKIRFQDLLNYRENDMILVVNQSDTLSRALLDTCAALDTLLREDDLHSFPSHLIDL